MEKKTLNVCRYYAGGIFLFSLIILLVSGNEFNFLYVLWCASILLMGVSMLTGVLPLLAAGAGLQVAYRLLIVIRAIPRGTSARVSFFITSAAIIAAYVLVFLSVFNRSNAIKFCCVAGILLIIPPIVNTAPALSQLDNGLSITLGAIRDAFFNTVQPILLAACVLQFTPQSIPAKIPAKVSVTSVPSANESIEKLIRLKEMLDIGVITQEEFNTKKKQILDI